MDEISGTQKHVYLVIVVFIFKCVNVDVIEKKKKRKKETRDEASCENSELFQKNSRKSKKDLFTKIINGQKPLTFFRKKLHLRYSAGS